MARVFKTSEAQTIIEALAVINQLSICMNTLIRAQQKEFKKAEPMSEAFDTFENAILHISKAQDAFSIFMERIKDESTTKENP